MSAPTTWQPTKGTTWCASTKRKYTWWGKIWGVVILTTSIFTRFQSQNNKVPLPFCRITASKLVIKDRIESLTAARAKIQTIHLSTSSGARILWNLLSRRTNWTAGIGSPSICLSIITIRKSAASTTVQPRWRTTFSVTQSGRLSEVGAKTGAALTRTKSLKTWQLMDSADCSIPSNSEVHNQANSGGHRS